jgi:hypothetical protein
MTIKTKSSRHDIAEIWLQLMLNTNQSLNQFGKNFKIMKKKWLIFCILYAQYQRYIIWKIISQEKKRKYKRKEQERQELNVYFVYCTKFPLKSLVNTVRLWQEYYYWHEVIILRFLLSFACATILFYHICSTQFLYYMIHFCFNILSSLQIYKTFLQL